MPIISRRYAGSIGVVDANVFQRTVDYPEEFAAGFHLVLDDEAWVTVMVETMSTNWGEMRPQR